MKLINDLFEVVESSTGEAGFITTIKLYPGHIVYVGHFPGHPVTPGVIQIQIIHEILEKHFQRNLKLIKMPQCKFLKILNPNETWQINVRVEFATEEDILHIKAWGENGADIFFQTKFSLSVY